MNKLNYLPIQKILNSDINIKKTDNNFNCKSSYDNWKTENLSTDTILNQIKQIISEDERFSKYNYVAILDYNSKLEEYFLNKELYNTIFYSNIFQKKYEDNIVLKFFKYFGDDFAAQLTSFQLNYNDDILLLFFNDKEIIYKTFFEESKFEIDYGNYQLLLTPFGYILEKFKIGKNIQPILNENIFDDLKEEIDTFFESEDFYLNDDKISSDYKSGILIPGPPGSGKSLSIKYLLSTIKDSYNIFMDSADFSRSLYNFIKGNFDNNKKKIFVVEDIDSLHEYDRSGFLNFMDGCKTLNKILFIATTNYPKKVDEALKDRPSRFDKIVRIGFPYFETRTKFLKYYFPELSNEQLIDYADKTKGYTGSYYKYLYELHKKRKISVEEAIKRIEHQKSICCETFEYDLENNDDTKERYIESITKSIPKPKNTEQEPKCVEDEIINKLRNKVPRKPGESIDDCVSRNIPIIREEFPDMEMDQVIAIAYQTCKKPPEKE